MSYSCIINKLYDFCADEDSGEGGVPPTVSDWFPPVFRRERRLRLETLPKGSISRVGQIEYVGVEEYGKIGLGNRNRRSLTLVVDVHVGYHVGDHVDEANVIIMADDLTLQKWFQDPANYPTCDGVCTMKVDVRRSRVDKLPDDRRKLVITLALQII